MEPKCNLNTHGSITTLREGTAFCSSVDSTLKDLKLHKSLELSDESKGFMELVGCYLHPLPVSLPLLSIKGNEIYICALCDLVQDKYRSLFIYMLAAEEARIGYPSLVGHTTVTLPYTIDIFGRENFLEKNGLQLSPDGRFIVLFGSVKMPYCREGKENCPRSACTLNCLELDVIKIVEVKDGYVSVQQKLKTVDSMQCILVCEPDIVVAAGESGRLHLWTMNLTWRATAIAASAGRGIIGMLDGLVYSWELSTGTRLGTLHHFKGGRVSHIATDDSRSVLAVADDRGQLLVYRQT